MLPYPAEIPDNVELLRDVPFGIVGERPLLLDLALPKSRPAPVPSFVYFHGGAWETGAKEDGIPAICYYANHGFAGASVGYRLSGEAQFPAQIEDCQCAVRFLRAHAAQFRLDPHRIGAMGASSGGHLAVLLGLTGGSCKFTAHGGWEEFPAYVTAVCNLFGVTDLLQMPKKNDATAVSSTVRFLGGTLEEVRERYIEAGPLNYVHSGAPPFLNIHGSHDPIVPLHQSELLHDALRKADVESTLHVVEGAGHGSRNVITPEVRALILSFFEKHLGQS